MNNTNTNASVIADTPRDETLANLPARWADLAAILAPTERVIAWLELDLDQARRFASGIVLITDTRLLVKEHSDADWRAWAARAPLTLHLSDYAGVGTLTLGDTTRVHARWFFTIGRHPAARGLMETFASVVDPTLLRAVPEAEPALCPNCGATLPAEGAACPACRGGDDEVAAGRTLFRLWRFARPYSRQIFLGFALTVTSTAAALVPPYMTMPLMDKILIPFGNGQPIRVELVALFLGGLLGSALLAWGLGWGRSYIMALVGERIGADLRTTTFDHLLNLSLEYYGGKRTGDLMARLGSESDRICLFLSVHLLDFATDVLVITMTAAVLFAVNPWLALVTLLPLPLIGWMIHAVRDRLRFGFDKAYRIWAEVTNVLADTIPGIRVVKAFAQEHRESARFRDANRRNLAVNDRVNALWAVFSPTVTLLTEIGLLVVWGFGIWQVSKHQITVGVLTAFLTYISRFYSRLESMSRIVSMTQKAASGAKRIFEVLDRVSSVPEPTTPVQLPAPPQGRVDLVNVGFRYGNRAVLNNINLEIAPGEMVGLVGHSGSGKSTLVNLICRFYDVAAGAIRFDGIDIRALAITDYRRHIGLVLQEPFLFFGTLAENIAYGRPAASRAEIVAAARAAHAHDFILRLPQGYDSLVGERGQTLSGGERQRISIARALLIDPRLLILDEATSSVDSETEKEIQEALDNLVRGRTTIAIAHRLSTLQRANRLIILDRGEIVEVGTHASLMAKQGDYYRLYQTQARQAEAEHAAWQSAPEERRA